MAHIRRAVHRDAEALAKLAAQAAAEEGGQSALDIDRIRAHAFGGNALFEAWIAEALPVRTPIAHAVITKSYDFRRAAPLIELCELYITPQHRRMGLARQMMSAIAQRAVDFGARDLTITTGVNNAVAQKFFQAIGAEMREAAVFHMSADGIQWLATEAR